MTKSMFCPRCGTGDQSAESYCKRCGEWLIDPDALRRPGLFRGQTRDQKIRKMRNLEAVSAGLSLTAAAIIIATISTGRNMEMLPLAALCCVLVAAYQVVNFYIGHKIQFRIDQSRTAESAAPAFPNQPRTPELHSAAADQFTAPPSVVENSTELLQPVPRRTKRGE